VLGLTIVWLALHAYAFWNSGMFRSVPLTGSGRSNADR
jgi:hypothetical protein